MKFSRRSQPVPEQPERVEILTKDGELVPCEALFRDYDDDGVAIWVAVPVGREDLLRDQVDSLRCGRLPAKTGIVLNIRDY